MKKIVSLLGIFALCAASFTACNKVTENDIQEKGKHIIKVTPVMAETRTVLDESGNTISVKWADSDVEIDPEGNSKFHVWENNAKGLAEATLNQDNTIATITCAFDENTSTNLVYSSCFAKQLDDNGNPVILEFQNPGSSSFDPDADLLIGEDITKTSQPDELLVNFSRPVALVKMTLKGLEVGESLTSVSVTSKSGKMTGVYNRANGAFDFTNGEETIVVCPTGVTVGSDGTAPVYFVSAPVDNATLEIEVWTSKGGATSTEEYHYKKEFTKGISFPANKLTRFTANVTCCEVVPEETGEVTIFNETFAGFDTEGYTGGRDGEFGGSVAAKNFVDALCDNQGWTIVNGKAGRGCIKLGSSEVGSATTPALGITAASATLSFDAAIWNHKDDGTVLTLSIEGEGAITPETVTCANKAQWYTFSATITGANQSTKVKITGTPAKTRFFLDDIKVSEVRASDPNVVSLEIADNTEINASATEATVDIQSNKAWTVTSSDPLLANTPIKINGTAQTTSFTVDFAEANTSVTTAKVATLHVVAGAGEYAIEKDITITQKSVTPYITILADDRVQTVAASATSATFHVSACNFDWNVVSVTVDGVANQNYTATKGNDGIVTVSFPSNEANGATTLNKVIVVTVGDAELETKTCTITQLGETYVDPDQAYYVLVSETPSDWSGHYLIVAGTDALNGGTIAGKSEAPVSVAVAGGMIEATDVVKTYDVEIESYSTGYSIKGAKGYIGASSSGGLTVTSEKQLNTISLNSGVFSVVCNDLFLRYNAGYFRYYTSSTQNGANGNIALYKYNKEWTGGGDTPGGSKQIVFTYGSHEGWTISGATDKSSYYLLDNSGYIESPSFSFNTIESIVVKMRYFGGAQYGTLNASYNNTDFGTASPTTNKLAEYTMTLSSSPNNQSGKIRFYGSNTESEKGPGVAEITITYTE